MALLQSRRVWLAALVLALGPAGCGQRLYPVHGRVTLEDGAPLAKGVVVFEAEKGGPAVTARGDIKTDGIYQMGTFRPGDGAPAGKYRVLVNPIDLSDTPDEEKKLPFDAKYLKFETSGLTYEVKPTDENLASFRLARPAGEEARPPEDKPKEEPKDEAKPKDAGKPKG